MSQAEATKAVLYRSLEFYAERVGDPAPIIYQRFFASYPDAREMFGNDDGDLSKYRMMERVLTMLMDVAEGVEPRLCSFWITDHMGWGIGPTMVSDMLEIIVDTLRTGIGEDWSADMESAWQDLLARLMPVLCARMVEERGSTAAG